VIFLDIMDVERSESVEIESLPKLEIDVEGRAKSSARDLNNKYFDGKSEILAQDILDQYNQFIKTGQEYYPLKGSRASLKFVRDMKQEDIYKEIVRTGAILAAEKLADQKNDMNTKEIDEKIGLIAMSETGWTNIKHLLN